MNLRIRTRDNIIFNVSDKFGDRVAFTRGDTALNLDIVEKSFNNGALFIGERRIASKELSLSGELFNDTDEDFRANFNDFISYCSKAAYLEDTDNNIRTKVEFSGFTDSPYEVQGTINRMGYCDARFIQLTPFWEDLTEDTEITSGTDITLLLNNQGYLDTPAKFELTAAAACGSILIFISEVSRGIEIQDLLFGTDTALDDYVIDNENGIATIGDTELSRIDRITGGSGFFDFPVGSFTLNLKFSSSVDVTITYRKRYFI